MEEAKGFYVEPKRDCPHLSSNLIVGSPQKQLTPELAKNGPCVGCQDEKENWICLNCGCRFCSRYVNGHMKDHSERENHPVVASYSDFSVWCFSCDSYITHPSLFPILKALNSAKFGDAGTGGRYTAHTTQTQMEELQDPPEEFAKKVKELANLIRESKHLVVFTGAGVSTSAGVPDFRGPQGVWTLQATGGERTERTVSTMSAVATPTHMAINRLREQGILKHLISQNVDGLHRKSGYPPSCFSELHGNSTLEVCSNCGKEYLRDFPIESTTFHVTTRRCAIPGCGGALLDTIVNFQESLPMKELEKGLKESAKADLCLSLGSSLTVTPAANMPRMVGENRKGKLVIVNLQRTPLDSIAFLRIHGKADEVMRGVMKELELEIPPFILNRRVLISHQEDQRVVVEGVDLDGAPCSLFHSLQANFSSGRSEVIKVPKYAQAVQTAHTFTKKPNESEVVDLEMTFMGHYNEPNLKVQFKCVSGEKSNRVYNLSLNPMDQNPEWVVTIEDGKEIAKGQQVHKDQWPKTLEHPSHEHPLALTDCSYGQGIFRCNSCLKPGCGPAYHCKGCSFDLHPYCCLEKL